MTIKAYLNSTSWRCQENASSSYSLGAMNSLVSGKESALFWLNDVYTEEIKEAHTNAWFHIHDLNGLASYCNGWSLRQLINEGLGGIPGKVSSGPAKHLQTICLQIVNFLGIMSNESQGAQAFSSLDTYLAPFVKEEGLEYSQVKQCIQSLVYGLNVESRWAGMAPFTNITLDWTVPSDMKDTACYYGGGILEYTYSDVQEEMDMINRAFLEVMIDGDNDGRLFSYPIPTYNITEDFEWESENTELLFRMTAKYGIPYFSNFINSDLDPTDVRSMCCRLSLDKTELRRRGGGLFGADEFTGSIGVVTINLPGIANYVLEWEESYNDRGATQEELETDFFERLEELMSLAKESLELKRKKLIELNNLPNNKTLFPYTKRYLKNWDNHFSTIGLCGAEEAIQTMIGKSIGTPEGQKFGIEILEFMKKLISDFQEETGNLYNLEASPAESTSYRLAKHDIKNYGKGIKYQGTLDQCYYTNSTQLPVGFTDDLFEALELQEPLQSTYTGGTVFHSFIGEEIGWEECRNLVKKICTNFRIPYISITPTFSVCPNHGYKAGEHFECPDCGSESEVYSRIVGYYRPVSAWHKGKSKEYSDRVTYNKD